MAEFLSYYLIHKRQTLTSRNFVNVKKCKLFYSFDAVGNKQFILSDQDLWDKFRAGDKEAFSQIYEKSISDLYIYGCRFSPDQELVKDCIHDLFIDLHRVRSKVSRTDKILPYLMISLKRLVISKVKEQNLDKRVDFENLSFSFLLAEDEKLIGGDDEDLLQNALNQLTPRQREAIYLKYVLGLDYQELAKILNLNYQTSRNLVYRGLQKLRDSLNGKSILLLNIFQRLFPPNNILKDF